MTIIISSILIGIIVIRFFCDKYSEIKREIIYFDNDRQIKSKIFDAIQSANISKLDKIQIGQLFRLIPFYNKNMKIYKKIQQTIIDLQGKVNEYIDSFSTTKTLRLEEI